MQHCPNCRKLVNIIQSFYKDKKGKTVQEIICSICRYTISSVKFPF